jgi:DNA repair protein RecO (recombination protein O)
VRTEISSPAFVLRTRAYGESDRIVTLLTEHHGKVTGIAKGAKNSRRRFAGTLEPFVRVQAVFRPHGASELAFLVRCELLAALRAFTRDLDRFAAGSYVLELVDRLVLGREPGGEVFRLLDDALGLLDREAPAERVLRAFELHLLAVTGYAPAVDRCRACGADLGSVTAYLAPGRGGLVCRRCVPAHEPVRPIAPVTVRALGHLASAPLAGAAAADVAPATLAEAAGVTECLVAAVAAAPLRTRAFLARARVDSPGRVR